MFPNDEAVFKLLYLALKSIVKKMDDADQGMEASVATIRDRVRRQNAVTPNHQQAIYTEKLRPSSASVKP